MRRLGALLTLLAAGGCATTSANESAQAPLRVWIDADAAVGVTNRDVDDGVALIQAFASPELEITGVSAVFGNAPLPDTLRIAREIAARFGPEALPVAVGADSAQGLGVTTEASRALVRALEEGPLTILMLGPATNVATVLQSRPDLGPRIREIVAVAGRRPGARFTSGSNNARAHRDFNFELDPGGFRLLLESGVPVTLAPFELSSKVWITEDELRRLDNGPPASRYLAQAAWGWLDLWVRTFDVNGFNPFDTLAVAWLTHPHLLTCETLPVEIRVLPDDRTEPAMQGSTAPLKPYLLVAEELGPKNRVRYCHDVSDRFVSILMERLLSHQVSRAPASVTRRLGP